MPKRTIIFGNAFHYEPSTGDLSTVPEFWGVLIGQLDKYFRRPKSKQRFGSWVSFWSNQIADLSLFAGNGELAKRGSPPPQTLLEGR
jgi:hypothetical protein